jgi:hypothetical protein
LRIALLGGFDGIGTRGCSHNLLGKNTAGMVMLT